MEKITSIPTQKYIAPTIVIGIGGTGVEITRIVKSRVKAVHDGQKPDLVEFLALDTDGFERTESDQEILVDSERAEMGHFDATAVVERHLDLHPHIKAWWGENKVKGWISNGARQKRYIGRLALYVNWKMFYDKLIAKLLRIKCIKARESANQDIRRARVYIVSSLCGGTGSGMFLDVAFGVRQAILAGGGQADIVGCFLMPSCFDDAADGPQSDKAKRRIRANTYSSLKELNHFMKSGNAFNAYFPTMPAPADEVASKLLGRPFDRVYLVDRTNGVENLCRLRDAQRMVAQQIAIELGTHIGQVADSGWDNVQEGTFETDSNGFPCFVSGFVSASLMLPTVELKKKIRNGFASRLLDKENTPSKEELIRQTSGDLVNAWASRLAFARPSTASEQGAVRTLTSADRTKARETLQQVMSELRNRITEQYQTRGLASTLSFVKSIRDELKSKLDSSELSANKSMDVVGQFVAQRKNIQAREDGTLAKAWKSVGDKFRSDQKSAATIASDKKVEELNDINELIYSETLKLERLKLSTDAYKLLVKLCGSLIVEIDRLKIIFADVAAQLDVSKAGLIADDFDGRDDCFALASVVDDDLVPVDSKDPTVRKTYLEVREEAVMANIAKAIESFRASRKVFRMIDSPEPFEGESLNAFRLNISTLSASEVDELVDEVTDQLIAIAGDKALGVTMKGYLDWRYSKGTDKIAGTPRDPLIVLRRRLDRPFLSIDTARMGEQGRDNTQPIRLIGIGIDMADSQQAGADTVGRTLRNYFSEFRAVLTDDLSRIDGSFSVHLMSVNAVRNLDQFKGYYDEFLKNKDTLHLDPNWDMTEIA